MGARGAAIATVIAQLENFLLMLVLLPRHALPQREKQGCAPFCWKQYLVILLPVLLSEVLWSLGENVYAGIYGRMSTEASAAMNLINPVQGIVIGALCGLSQAAGVIVGKLLGEQENGEAYTAARKLLLYGLVGSVILSGLVVAVSPVYGNLYEVTPVVRKMAQQIMLAYALVAPLKVLNMILGGGILRSGGKTTYVMVIDAMGTWCFGVPLGLLTAFVLHWPAPLVYFCLSLEEGVRLAVSLVVFRRKKWMQRLTVGK